MRFEGAFFKRVVFERMRVAYNIPVYHVDMVKHSYTDVIPNKKEKQQRAGKN